MSRPDLNESDLQGLDYTYRKACAERRLAPLEEPEELEQPARWESLVNTYAPPVALALLLALCIWIWGRPWA